MAFDCAGFPNDLPAAPRKRRYVINKIGTTVAILLFLWWFLQEASDAIDNLVTVAAMSRLL
jgi:hypothetical protein